MGVTDPSGKCPARGATTRRPGDVGTPGKFGACFLLLVLRRDGPLAWLGLAWLGYDAKNFTELPFLDEIRERIGFQSAGMPTVSK